MTAEDIAVRFAEGGCILECTWAIEAALAEAYERAAKSAEPPHKNCMHMKCEGKWEAAKAIRKLIPGGHPMTPSGVCVRP